MTTTKRSFAELQAEVDAQKSNSDLLNLAHTAQHVQLLRAELVAYVTKVNEALDTFDKEISETAAKIENGDFGRYDDVKGLWDKTRTFKIGGKYSTL
ncbi:hypothetical protein PHIN3_190 [Sinorhizobium phage phiN3]|uniref:Uncharacterized protein n=1 Tax=Sinorhizobium phage phiN3 TaxID=1647405 RepID=A0A0F6SJ23_9CAUD|nr:hypothetical protein AVT40_gp343 [Sinorhizobium phage phiN3]AKF13453.1 hypothetical protein PHIN3_190 [Sinorhizobium phage phiN3]